MSKNKTHSHTKTQKKHPHSTVTSTAKSAPFVTAFQVNVPTEQSAAQHRKLSGPSSTPGNQIELQVMTMKGSFKTVTLRQNASFEFLLLNGGSVNAQEILCDNAETAKAWHTQFKQKGHRVQTGERSFGL